MRLEFNPGGFRRLSLGSPVGCGLDAVLPRSTVGLARFSGGAGRGCGLALPVSAATRFQETTPAGRAASTGPTADSIIIASNRVILALAA